MTFDTQETVLLTVQTTPHTTPENTAKSINVTRVHTKTKIVLGVHVVENYVIQSNWDTMTGQTRKILYLLHI